MGKRRSPLDSVRVAAPCSVGWDSMAGTGRVRFCGQCEMRVYNLSEMTRDAAERLIAESEGRLCVRYYRRADGTILTKNCPVGLRALRRRASRVATAAASAVLTFFTGMLAAAGLRDYPKVSVGAKVSAAAPVPVIEIDEHVLPVTGTLAAPEPRMGRVAPRYYPEDWEAPKLIRISPKPRKY